MQKIHLLFFNQDVPNSKVRKVISEKYNLTVFNFAEQFRKQMMEEENELVIKIKSFIDNGFLIPDQLLKEFLTKTINSHNNKILLTGFPRKMEHCLTLLNMDVTIEAIWYIKQQDPEKYMTEHFKKPDEKAWLEKFGEEIVEKWKQDFETNQSFFAEIQKVTENKIWKILEVDYEMERDEEAIANKIDDLA